MSLKFNNQYNNINKRKHNLKNLKNLVPFLVITAIFAAVIFHPFFLKYFLNINHQTLDIIQDEYTWVYYTLMCILTGIVAWNAYLQLHNLNSMIF